MAHMRIGQFLPDITTIDGRRDEHTCGCVFLPDFSQEKEQVKYMIDQETLQAISEMMDEKLDERLYPVKEDLHELKDRADRTEQAVQKVNANVDELKDRADRTEQAVQKVNANVDELKNRMDRTEQAVQKLNANVDELKDRADRTEQAVQKVNVNVDELKNRMDRTEHSILKINVTLENEVMPRLDTIERCYVDTYKRYQRGADDFEFTSDTVKVIANVVRDHSSRLEALERERKIQ